MRIIPPQISESARWFFKIDFSRNKGNLPRLFAQVTAITTTLTLFGLAFYKLITNRNCSLNFSTPSVKKIVNKKLGEEEINSSKVKESEKIPFERCFPGYRHDSFNAVRFRGINTFGSKENLFKTLREEDKRTLANVIKQFLLSNPRMRLQFETQFCKDVQRENPDLLSVDLSFVTHPDKSFYVTIEVIEKKDKEKRTSFTHVSSSVKITPQGLGGLLPKMKNYLYLGTFLAERGEIKAGKNGVTLPWHSAYGHEGDLSSYKDDFIQGVKEYQKGLEDTFLKGIDDSVAEVALLLAYGYEKDGQRLVDILVQRLHDQNKKIRENILNILKSIAEKHPEINLPLSEILISLHHPCWKDRAAATTILTYILNHKKLNEIDRVRIKDGLEYNANLLSPNEP
ncbi:MAG: hypothetical protein L0207_03395 [Chlamydiae bacterium]|nr:hypothetical protein [Chlamydiota bacterium]